MGEEPKPAESGGQAAGEQWPRLNGSSHGTPDSSLVDAARQGVEEGEVPLEESEASGRAASGRNEDPLIPEVFRDVIPPPPRGWSEDRWRASFLGDQRPAVRGSGLNVGRAWLLALVFALVALVLIIVIAVAH